MSSAASSSFCRGGCTASSLCRCPSHLNGRIYCFVSVLLFHLLSILLLGIRPQQLFLEKLSPMYFVTLCLFSNRGIVSKTCGLLVFGLVGFFSCGGLTDLRSPVPNYNTSAVLTYHPLTQSRTATQKDQDALSV